jgi:adenylate cyclase class IV
VKMSLDYVHESWKVVSIKNKLWRKSEMEGTLKILWFHPVAKVKVRRISLEFKWSDFDIDIFPNIPPFIEIDSDKPESIETMISKLWLDEHLKVTYSTIKVFEKYWFDYYDIFKI